MDWPRRPTSGYCADPTGTDTIRLSQSALHIVRSLGIPTFDRLFRSLLQESA